MPCWFEPAFRDEIAKCDIINPGMDSEWELSLWEDMGGTLPIYQCIQRRVSESKRVKATSKVNHHSKAVQVHIDYQGTSKQKLDPSSATSPTYKD
jgi:hypothetical protein